MKTFIPYIGLPRYPDIYKKYVGTGRGDAIEARGDPILGGSLVLAL